MVRPRRSPAFVPAAVPWAFERLGVDRVAIGVAALFARDLSPLSEVPDDEDVIMHVLATSPLPHLLSMSGKLWTLYHSHLRLFKIMTLLPDRS